MIEAVPTQSVPAAPAAQAPALVRTRALGKTIEERPILRNIDLEVRAGEFLSLLGANGAGKSTLLKILATLMPATDGSLELFDASVRGSAAVRARGRIGLIGHQTMLYHDLSAQENLEFFGRLYGVKNVTARAKDLLARLGLANRAGDPVKAFSRGMAQRVGIARALMHDPDLLLADEPFAGLDAPSSAILERVLVELHRAGKTIVLTNHDIAQSLRLAQRVAVLKRGVKVIDAAVSRVDAATVLSTMEAP